MTLMYAHQLDLSSRDLLTRGMQPPQIKLTAVKFLFRIGMTIHAPFSRGS
jgi:hypothetical protein